MVASERTFSKPPAARQVEARARARQKGVKVAVVSEARKYVSNSLTRPGTLHTIERTPAGWACSCEGYEHTGMCQHLGAVERRSEREGWRFGMVAPLAKVARYMPLDPPLKTAAQLAAQKRSALSDLYGDDVA